MEYKDNQIMDIEEVIIENGVVYAHSENQDYEANLDEVLDLLEKELRTTITHDDYRFYEIQNEFIWNDTHGNEESEFEEFEIELSIVSRALLMSGSLKEIETV